jgi:hypothetical protein
MISSVAGTLYKIIPETEKDCAKIVHRVLTKDDVALENMRARMHGRPDRECPPGTYTVLHTRPMKKDGYPDTTNWQVMMSDTPYELIAGRPLKVLAHGHVLILGLGLGATTIPVLAKDAVTSVTVIEKNKDVIDIVKPCLNDVPGGSKLDVQWADAFKWKPAKGVKFNTIWMDIWPTICGDNLPEITKLKRKYSPLLDRDGKRHWMGIWEEDYLRREAREQRAL